MQTKQEALSEIGSAIERYVDTRMKRSRINPDHLDVVLDDYRNWMYVHIKKQLGLKKIKQLQRNHLPIALQIIEQEKIRFT